MLPTTSAVHAISPSSPRRLVVWAAAASEPFEGIDVSRPSDGLNVERLPE